VLNVPSSHLRSSAIAGELHVTPYHFRNFHIYKSTKGQIWPRCPSYA